jgi:hypothetical protein
MIYEPLFEQSHIGQNVITTVYGIIFMASSAPLIMTLFITQQ